MNNLELKEFNIYFNKRFSNFEKEYAVRFLELNYGIKLIRCNRKNLGKNYKKGIPDYFYENIYIEIKTNNDSLRKEQIKWIMENKDEKVMIVWFNIKKKMYIEKDKEIECKCCGKLNKPNSNLCNCGLLFIEDIIKKKKEENDFINIKVIVLNQSILLQNKWSPEELIMEAYQRCSKP